MRRQRGSIVQKGDMYFIKYRDLHGKQRMEGSCPGRGFRSRTEAQSRLNKVLDDIVKGDYVELRRITFEDFADQWIRGRVSIRGSTESAYGSIIRQHLIPYLGSLQVHEIQLDVVQRLVAKLVHKMPTKTLRNCITLLHVMLVGKKGTSAIKLGYIRHDPTRGLELPSQGRDEVQPPTIEQVWKLIDTAAEMAKGSPCAKVAQAAIFIDAFTGLRRGELLALHYSDVDWFAGEVLISKAISKIRANDGVHKWLWKLGPTKNRKSRRVGIHGKVLGLLADLKRAATDPNGLVFTPDMSGGTGGLYPFIDPDYFNASIYGPIAEAADLNHVRFHDLRHFFASMLIAQGETAKYVCDQMGHSSIQVTFDVYGHLFPQARREASTKLERAMYAGRKEQSVESLVENPPRDVGNTSLLRKAN